MISEKRLVARATALILLSSCCFGSLTTLTLFVTRAGLPLLSAMFWRYLLAAAALLLVVRSPLRTKISKQQALRLVIVGGLGQAIITYLSLRALDYLPVGPLAFLFYTYPAWVALVAAVTGKEKLTAVRSIALTVAMGGIAVMVGMPSAGSLNLRGVLLALATALLYALYLPALHKVQQGIPSLVSAFYLITGAFLSFLLANIFTRQLQLPETLSLWALLVVLSLIGTVIAFVSLIAGLCTLGPVRTSIISTIEPFFTVLLGVIALREPFTAATVAGGSMIAGAVLLLQLRSRP